MARIRASRLTRPHPHLRLPFQMPRRARIVIPGVPHHVTQRGNNRHDVFFADDDREFFLSTLRDRCERYGVEILAYCLMTNHTHLVAVPSASDSLAKGIGGTNEHYALYLNRRHGRTGHVWQGRFDSTPMDDRHFLFAMTYVERNPVRARMVSAAVDYPWSSAAAHCGEPDKSGLIDAASWARRFPPNEWAAILRDHEDEELSNELRRTTFTGRPLGSDHFIAKLEAVLGRRLRPNPIGRLRQTKQESGDTMHHSP